MYETSKYSVLKWTFETREQTWAAKQPDSKKAAQVRIQCIFY